MTKHVLPIPGGKNFIFSVFDDTDVATLENIRPVYDCLTELGIYTTKSVWPLDSQVQTSNYRGSHSLQNPAYAAYIRELAQRGFEIAFHGSAMESSPRDVTIQALGQFREILGFSPRTYAAHAGNQENIYWGKDRFQFAVFRLLYSLLNRDRGGRYAGHDRQSRYYWADICQETFDYVRTFTFNDINLLNIGRMPYQVQGRGCFNNCFFTSFADHVEEFNRLLSLENQAKLVREHGVCIVTTHFGKGFVKDDKLNGQTRFLLERLVENGGCFMPVHAVLDYLKKACGQHQYGPLGMFALEGRWFWETVYRKLHRLDYEKTELKYLGVP